MNNYTKSFGRFLAVATILALIATAPAENTTATKTASGSSSVTTTAVQPVKEGAHRIISANILLASPANEGKPGSWAHRRALAVQTLKYYKPDILCLQEVLKSQAEDFESDFPDFHHLGFADAFMDKNAVGYHGVAKNVILFRKDRYALTGAGSYWLSETPLIAGSRSWDSRSSRHVNFVRLKDRSTGREFRVLNTHFDHKGQTARENAAAMINEEAAQYNADFPQILCGDFNATASNQAIISLQQAGWTNTYAALHGPEDPGRTFHNLLGDAYALEKKGGQIDFIFTRGALRTSQAAILKDHENDRYPSDHYFMLADLELTPSH